MKFKAAFIQLLFILTAISFYNGYAQQIRPEVLARVKQIEQEPYRQVTWLNGYTIEIKDQISGLQTQFDLRINKVNPDSIDQVIDLIAIDTSQFSGMYRLWQTIPIGSRFGDALIISDINDNSLLELVGGYLVEPVNNEGEVAIFEMENDSIFYLKKLYSDSVERAIGPFPTDLDNDALKEFCLIIGGGFGIKNKESVFPDSFPDSTNFVSDLYMLRGNNRIVDLDQDGFMDYITIGSDSSTGIPTYIAEYDPGLNNFMERFAFNPQPFTFIYNYSVGDSDADGLNDCVGSSVSGRVFMIESLANDQYQLVWTDSISNANASLMAATNDMDNNGKPEFIIGATGYYQGQSGTELYWYEMTGDNQYEVIRRIFLIGTDFFGSNILYAYDVDGDGQHELVFDFDFMLLILKANNQQFLDVYYLNYPVSMNQSINAITASPYQIGSDLLISIQDSESEPFYKSLYYKRDAITSISPKKVNEIYQFRLHQNYPNPFNHTSIIPFLLKNKQSVSLIIYDITGKEVARLINDQVYSPGEHQIKWNGLTNTREEVSSGIYFYVLESSRFKLTRKLLLIR